MKIPYFFICRFGVSKTKEQLSTHHSQCIGKLHRLISYRTIASFLALIQEILKFYFGMTKNINFTEFPRKGYSSEIIIDIGRKPPSMKTPY